MMEVSSVNVGEERAIRNAKSSGKTGIFKLPARDAVRVTYDGLEGDVISDAESHGGPDQAVYIYGIPDYEWWSETLGRELSPGTFGENLTISGLESARFRIGDQLHAGSVILEVTAPRIPCVTLATRMEDPSFAKRFRQAERPGLYCRVIREGYVSAGDEVELEEHRGETITAIEMFRDFFDPDPSEATVRRHLASPIAIRDRVEKEKRLEEILSR